jgi:ATP phosphoribosyltransferase
VPDFFNSKGVTVDILRAGSVETPNIVLADAIVDIDNGGTFIQE